jgi:hypothetical protein
MGSFDNEGEHHAQQPAHAGAVIEAREAVNRVAGLLQRLVRGFPLVKSRTTATLGPRGWFKGSVDYSGAFSGVGRRSCLMTNMTTVVGIPQRKEPMPRASPIPFLS